MTTFTVLEPHFVPVIASNTSRVEGSYILRSAFVLASGRPDMTFAIDWSLKTNDLSYVVAINSSWARFVLPGRWVQLSEGKINPFHFVFHRMK